MLRGTRIIRHSQILAVTVAFCAVTVVLGCAADRALGSFDEAGIGGQRTEVGGAAGTGGSSAGGSSSCAQRSETYTPGVEFPHQYASVIGYPECVPTCNVPSQSVEALPAGPCAGEPTCAMMAFWPCPGFCHNADVDGGDGTDVGSLGANSFLCACANNRWSCTIAQ